MSDSEGAPNDLEGMAFSVTAVCGVALVIALALVFYAQIGWILAFDAIGVWPVGSPFWTVVLVVCPAATVAVLPALVAGILTENRRYMAISWAISAGIIGLTLGLHDLIYGPVYLG